MSLSKPLFDALSFYLEQLFMHPLRTKSITRFVTANLFPIEIYQLLSIFLFFSFLFRSCVLASSANVVSQKLMGHKEINQQSLFAYALFGSAIIFRW